MAITGISSYDGKQIIAAGAQSAIKAYQDSNGDVITSKYQTTAGMSDYATTASVTGKQDTLTFGYTDDQISQINGSGIYSQGGGGASYTGNVQEALDKVYTDSANWDNVSAKQDKLTFNYDGSNNITGINSSAIGGGGGGVVTATGGTTTYVQTINEKPVSATIANSAEFATYAPNGASLDSTFNYAASGYAASAYLASNVTGNVANWNAATSAVTANSASWTYPVDASWSDYDIGTAFFGTGINIGDNINIKFKPGNFMTSYSTGSYRVMSTKIKPGVYSVTASLSFNNIMASQWALKNGVFTVTNGHIISGPQMFNCFPEWGNEPWIQLLTEGTYTTALDVINRNIRNSTATDDNKLIISFNTLIIDG